MTNTPLVGRVQSGGPGSSTTRHLAGVSVTVYEATEQDPRIIGSAETDASGQFQVQIDRDKPESIFYAVATVNENIQLATIIGDALPQSDQPAWVTASPPTVGSEMAASAGSTQSGAEETAPCTAYVTINELTTVAAAFSMAQFIQGGAIGGDAFGLQIASLMFENLVDRTSGGSSEVLLSPPNGDETNSLRSMRSLANLIAACINNVPNAATNLFTYTTPPYDWGPAPANTFEAMFNIARYPANNVPHLYQQSTSADTYSPALANQPDAWTLAVKVNDTGSRELLFGGPANIAFDKRGYAWITNNVVQGTPNSGCFGVVLKPNGKPADGKSAKTADDAYTVPRSPLLGGGLLGGGFGVAIDNNQNAWFSNFGWGATIYQPAEGSVSVFSPDGKPISPPEGFIGSTDVRTDRVQDIAIDPDNNVWLASYEYGQVVVFPDGNQDNAFAASIPDGSKPFGIAISEDGSAWVTSSKDLWAYSEGRLSKFQIEDGQLNCVYSAQLGRGLKGLAIDSGGNIWVPSGGDDALYLFNSDGVELGLFMARGGINGPWGIAVDGNDNIWVSNFGKMLPNDVYSNAAISQLAGANQNTRPRSDGFATGQEITPETGYTLPTGGAQVRLRNGDPLYGQGAEPCCSPLMRMTNVVIDRAGNVWAVNNWKPDFDNDAAPTTGNPGGDGIVIFVGLAKPPAN